MFDFPEGKRYNSFVGYFRKTYGERLQKIVIDAGFTCPNRDGTVGRGGCTYCDNAAFHPAYSSAGKPLHAQIDEGIEFHKVRYRNASSYLAYFQSYSNTYAPLGHLQGLYLEALSHPQVAGIVIGTRPDCVDEGKLDWLASLAEGSAMPGWSRVVGGVERKAPIVIVEYGIESCYDSTLARINRAMINSLPLRSVKFHQLQIVKGTRMEKEYAACPEDFVKFPLEGYIDFFVDMLERLRPDLYIERFAGEVPPRFVKETPWGLIRNVELLRLLDRRLEERLTWQGRRLEQDNFKQVNNNFV